MGFARSLVGTLKVVWYFTRYGAELAFTQPKTRAERAAWLHRFCAATLEGMGIAVTVEGSMPAGALVSNHLGYLDIISLAAIGPCVFCSKIELKRVPVLGWFVRMAGTVFVDRGRGGSAMKARGEMEEAFQEGLTVVFFPEGTTSNGEQLLEFHSGLLAQAMDVGMSVTPAFAYYKFDEPNGAATVANDVNFWGDISMWPHIWRFLSLRGVHGFFRIADSPVVCTAAEDRKEVAIETRAAVLALGRKSGVNLPD